jgi:hypothetical protein
MGPLHSGFADELVKTAGRANAVLKLLERINTSKDLRSAIRRSALLGAGTGAATSVLGGDGKKSTLRRGLGGAALGAVGGGITGAAYPGWFTRAMRLAPDEVGTLARLGRR